MEPVEAPDLRPCRRRRPVDDPQEAPQRALQPGPRIRPEVAVLIDALGDQRVGDLQEQGPRSRREQQHCLPVEAPGLTAGAIQTQVRVIRPRTGTASTIIGRR